MKVNIEKSVVSQNIIELTAREIENGHISLVWNHSMDNDAHQTIIERSCDLDQWEEIISLPYGSEVKQFEDSKPCNGINYYRLKLKDLNDNYNYSEVEVANINFAEIRVYPNPVSSQEEVNITSSEKEDLQVLIMDQSGKTVFKSLFSQKLLLSSSDYPSGSYYVLIFNNDNLISKSLLVIE